MAFPFRWRARDSTSTSTSTYFSHQHLHSSLPPARRMSPPRQVYAPCALDESRHKSHDSRQPRASLKSMPEFSRRWLFRLVGCGRFVDVRAPLTYSTDSPRRPRDRPLLQHRAVLRCTLRIYRYALEPKPQGTRRGILTLPDLAARSPEPRGTYECQSTALGLRVPSLWRFTPSVTQGIRNAPPTERHGLARDIL